MNRFVKKVCLITGAASGIGKATTLAFGREGAILVLADTNGPALAAICDEILKTGSRAVAVETNIARREDVENMVAVAVHEFGSLDCAANCAGIAGSLSLPVHEYPEEEWLKVIQVNLTGTWYCVKEEIRQMLKQGGGRIVNVSSAAGLVGHPENVPYSASKHGIIGITKTAAIEYATKNIRVNAVCPTAIETPMLMQGRRNLSENPAALEAAKNYQVMKRMGRPEEVADVILWLCSEQSSFITGHAMAVDGGAFA